MPYVFLQLGVVMCVWRLFSLQFSVGLGGSLVWVPWGGDASGGSSANLSVLMDPWGVNCPSPIFSPNFSICPLLESGGSLARGGDAACFITLWLGCSTYLLIFLSLLFLILCLRLDALLTLMSVIGRRVLSLTSSSFLIFL